MDLRESMGKLKRKRQASSWFCQVNNLCTARELRHRGSRFCDRRPILLGCLLKSAIAGPRSAIIGAGLLVAEQMQDDTTIR